ncbi:dihydrodipicolinate synthase family protein [Amycolatopsis speibonae]|uniref:Dihydrodipicolinate synthase family protein n=1 Tax=Amycolatopsis speibonae TaxID=1450224 RepID=A0ABV7NXJ0_9PSEU
MADTVAQLDVRGVYNILATPFTEIGDVDVASIRSLVEGVLASGVDGLTVLGVAGEAHKLTVEERSLVAEEVIKVTNGRVPVIVGASYNDLSVAVTAIRDAANGGAAGVMVAPPKGSTAGSELTEYYRRIADDGGLPIVLQDYPAATGVSLTPEEMADLLAAVPQITTIKLESLPTPVRIAKTLGLVPQGTAIVGGMGGMYLLDELRHGAAGTMTGFSYSEALRDIYGAWRDGNVDVAKSTYAKYLRLLVFEGQVGVGLAIRKELLRRRGFIAHAGLRSPGDQLDDLTAADLTELLADLGLSPNG